MPNTVWLVSHAANAAMRTGTFPPTPDPHGDAVEALDARAVQALGAWRERWQTRLADAAAVLTSPAPIARATALAAGFDSARCVMHAALADADYGAWGGRRLTDLARSEPDALAAWTRDPAFRPPGGESFEDVRTRVGAWLDALPANPPDSGDLVAFTPAQVIRAAILHALGAPSTSFRHLEIAPLAVTALRRTAHGLSWLAVSS
ncbi:histidine phosphatase family protein [Paraburkholderia sp. J12]|uniref:histidine phosphatase family protein n=1 Tax=Paraburkholderia sp. J12 TaxID=2805432 RepID=UPI002ABD7A41|nr:histidine phosphatase family protein [Paraburkholderia sp. J12]